MLPKVSFIRVSQRVRVGVFEGRTGPRIVSQRNGPGLVKKRNLVGWVLTSGSISSGSRSISRMRDRSIRFWWEIALASYFLHKTLFGEVNKVPQGAFL